MKPAKRLGIVAVSVLGLILVVYALLAAVGSNFLWYDFFTVGLLLLLAPISYQLRGNTLLEVSLRSPFLLLILYLIFYLIGFAVEFCGTSLADLWYYPHYDREAQAFHSLVVGYPFAFMALIPLYELVEHGVFLLFEKRDPRPRSKRQGLVPMLLLALGLILVMAPFADKYLATGTYVRQFCIVAMFGGIVLLDSLRWMFSGDSLFLTIRRGDYRYVVALIAASSIAALINEVPNTLPQTWIYHNIPFVQLKLVGVNVIVLSGGWIFLTFVATSIFRILERKSNRPIRKKDLCLCLERPAVSLGLPYVIFWLVLGVLLVLMRWSLLVFVGAHDKYFFLTCLMALGLIWIPTEIIWSYRGLLKLQEVIGIIATPSSKKQIETWYKKQVICIYRFRNMVVAGLLIAGLFSPLIFKQKALHWTGSQTIFQFDIAYYLFILFLGGMSQFPFYGMSILALSLPTKPLKNISLFLTEAGDVRRFGRFFGLVGLGGLGLIAVAEVWLYIAPVKTVWLYVQLIVFGTCIGAVLWFLLTQYNVHKLIVREKKVHLDKVCAQLNSVFQDALKNPSGTNYHHVSILASLKTHIEQLPNWPFSTTSIVQLVTAAGAVAALVPLIEFFRKLLQSAK